MHLSYSINKGLSLPEVLVILALLSFTFYFSITSFNQITTKYSLDNIANELTNILIYTRNHAILANENISVCTTQDITKCNSIKTKDNKFSWNINWVVFKDNDNSQLIDKSKILYFVASTKKKINISFNNGNKITFNNTGKCLKSGSFLITKDNQPLSYKIIISLAGRIKKEQKSEDSNEVKL